MDENENREDREMEELLSSYRPVFKGGFAGRVLERLDETQGKLITHDFNNMVYSMFRRIATVGAAAIAILLFSIYLSGRGLDRDILIGDSYSDDELVSYLLYQDIEE